jgi:hypothetical protein
MTSCWPSWKPYDYADSGGHASPSQPLTPLSTPHNQEVGNMPRAAYHGKHFDSGQEWIKYRSQLTGMRFLRTEPGQLTKIEIISGKLRRWRAKHERHNHMALDRFSLVFCCAEIPIFQSTGCRRRQRRNVPQRRDLGGVALRVQRDVQDHRPLGFRLGRIRRKGRRVQLRRKKCRILRRDGLNLRWRRQRNVVRSKEAGIVHDVDRQRRCHGLSFQRRRRVRPRAHRRRGRPGHRGDIPQNSHLGYLTCIVQLYRKRNHSRVQATHGIGNVSCFAHVRRNEMRRLSCLARYRPCHSKNDQQYACGSIENSLHRCNPQALKQQTPRRVAPYTPFGYWPMDIVKSNSQLVND